MPSPVGAGSATGEPADSAGGDRADPAPWPPSLGTVPEEGREVATGPRPARRWVVSAGALGVVIALLAARVALQDAVPEREFEPAPDFDVAALGRPGERLRLRDLRGTPVLVNFWASWCVPCRQEMPELQAVRDRYGGELEVIGVNMWDDPAEAVALLDELGITYPQGVDEDNAVVTAYGIDVVPSTAFITSEGRFVAVANGKPSPEEFQAMIERHLGL